MRKLRNGGVIFEPTVSTDLSHQLLVYGPL
jgi:hypothetical protein